MLELEFPGSAKTEGEYRGPVHEIFLVVGVVPKRHTPVLIETYNAKVELSIQCFELVLQGNMFGWPWIDGVIGPSVSVTYTIIPKMDD